MRIVHFIESHTIHTKRILDYQVAAGHEAHVLTLHDFVRDDRAIVASPPASLRRLPYAHHWEGLARVRGQIRRLKPDLLHGHYLSTAALYLLGSDPTPVVASAMGSDVLVDTNAAHVRLLLRAMPAWVDLFTSGAPHLTARMVELGIPRGRIVTFPWGVDLRRFHPPPESPATAVILSCRNFEPVYDVRTLLDAFPDLLLRIPGARLRLYGDGSLRGDLEARAAARATRDHVDFLGRVDSEALAQGYRDARVYVSTSRSDAASVSLLEAMASGLVPVVTDIDANRPWVSDGVNGLLFPPGDARGLASALERALTDEALRRRALDRNPRTVAELASWDVSMRRLEAVYRSAMA